MQKDKSKLSSCHTKEEFSCVQFHCAKQDLFQREVSYLCCREFDMKHSGSFISCLSGKKNFHANNSSLQGKIYLGKRERRLLLWWQEEAPRE